MRKRLACFVFVVAAASLPAQDSPSSQTSLSSRTSHITASDSHEGVTIGIDPWTEASRYKEKFPKKSPFAKGIVAIHVSFTNENDQGLKVNLQSIRLIVQLDEDNRQQLAPMSADDVADAVMLSSAKDPTSKRIPIPIPRTAPRAARDSNWTNFRDACQNAGVPTSVVAAHSTVEGLVYFNLGGETDLLHTAHLYFPNIISMSDNQPLSYFDIALGHDSSS